MNIKSFLLGIGLGITFSSLVGLILYNGEEKAENIQSTEVSTDISDNEVEQRAKALGMVYITELPEQNEKPEETEVETKSSESYQEDKKTPTEGVKDEYVDVVIYGGWNATKVADALYEKGIISDKKEFTSYMINNRKTTKIRTGTYKMNNKMDYSEIVNIITTK